MRANILYASRTKASKAYKFSDQANAEMDTLVAAVREIMDRTISVFVDNDMVKAFTVERSGML